MALSSFTSLGRNAMVASAIYPDEPLSLTTGSFEGLNTSTGYAMSTNLKPLGNNYTIEFYLKVANQGGTGVQTIIYIKPQDGASPSNQLHIMYGNVQGNLQIYNVGNGINISTHFSPTGTNPDTWTYNVWRHVAYVYTGNIDNYSGTIHVYINGVNTNSTSVTNGRLDSSNNYNLYINANPSVSFLENCKTGTTVTNIRISKKAVYSGNFTPPNLSFNLQLYKSPSLNSSHLVNTDVILLLRFKSQPTMLVNDNDGVYYTTFNSFKDFTANTRPPGLWKAFII
jgi:hypothetical protein